MTEIISVRFKDGGKSYYFNPNGMTVAVGDRVIIETSRGVEFGECVEGNRLIDEMELVSPCVRCCAWPPTPTSAAMEKNKEKEARKATRSASAENSGARAGHEAGRGGYNFDGSKILFFFTSEGRVDFRALVRDLVSIFHTRIELRQIGVRDGPKCWAVWASADDPTAAIAFERFPPGFHQNGENSEPFPQSYKISGACGWLMCCLKYEQEAYEGRGEAHTEAGEPCGDPPTAWVR